MELKSGIQTSEFKLTVAGMFLGALLAFCTAFHLFTLTPEQQEAVYGLSAISWIVLPAVYAFGRSLIKSRGISGLLIFVLAGSLVIGSVACGPPSKKTIEKLHTGALVVVNELTFNASLPVELLAEKIIDQSQFEKMKVFFDQALLSASRVERGLAVALMMEKPSIAGLALLVVDILANLRSLTSLVNNERVQRMFAAVQIGLRVLGSYFALQVGKLRAAGFSDRQICERFHAPYDKGRFDLLANTYDGARFDEWAAAL